MTCIPPPCTSVSELLATREPESKAVPAVGLITTGGCATMCRPERRASSGTVITIVSGAVISYADRASLGSVIWSVWLLRRVRWKGVSAGWMVWPHPAGSFCCERRLAMRARAAASLACIIVPLPRLL